jgi:hypothetical protein
MPQARIDCAERGRMLRVNKTMEIAAVCVWCAVIVSVFSSQAQQVDIRSKATSGLGWHPQYEIHIDPENSDNMIVCGIEFDAKDNAFYDYVSYSSDQGKTWDVALQPKNSTFESEESCAYGVHGVAYLVTSASKVIEDEAHHEQGTTRIYVSHDSGKTWALGVKTGWNDWSTSVVDTAPGPNQNRLYAFFNGNLFYQSLGRDDPGEAQMKTNNNTGSYLAMITYKDGDSQVGGPVFVTALAAEKYTRGGSFPGAAMVLKDGAVLTLNSTKHRTDKNVAEYMIQAIRTTPDRTGLDKPVKVVSSLDTPADDNASGVTCSSYFLDSAATYDSVHDTVYFAFGQVNKKMCQLMLTNSTDGGKTWSMPQVIRASAADGDQEFGNPAIAINKDGLIAMMWQKTYRTGCWMFATSTDDGKTLSRATQIGTCAAAETKPSELSSNYLWDSFFQADPHSPDPIERINLRNTREAVWRNEDSIAVTPDGAFHPVWSDAGNGDGELRTAEIHVTPVEALITNATEGLTDVTTRVAVLYGGNQSYDPKTKIITLDTVIKNNSDQPLSGPFKLTVPGLYKDFGFGEIANSDNKVAGGGAVWDISSSVGPTLAPGATSKPFALKFRYTADEDTPRDSDDILGLRVKVYAGR